MTYLVFIVFRCSGYIYLEKQCRGRSSRWRVAAPRRRHQVTSIIRTNNYTRFIISLKKIPTDRSFFYL